MPPKKKKINTREEDASMTDDLSAIEYQSPVITTLRRRSVARVDSPRPNTSSTRKKNNSSKFKSLSRLAEKSQDSPTTKGRLKEKKRIAFEQRTNLIYESSSASDNERSKCNTTSRFDQETPRSRKQRSYVFSSTDSDNDSDDFVTTEKKSRSRSKSRIVRKRKRNPADDLSPIRPCPDLFEDPMELTPKDFLKENLKSYSPRILPQKKYILKNEDDIGPTKRARKGDSFATNPVVKSWVEQMKAEFSDVEMHELCIESD